MCQQPSSKRPVCMKMFPSTNLVERLEKCYWPATPTVIWGCPPAEAGAGPSLLAGVIRPLHKPLYTLAQAPNCTHKVLESRQDGFQRCLHSSAGLSIAHLQLTSIWVSSCPSYWTVTPASWVLPRRLLKTDGGRWRKFRDWRKKPEGKAFSFIYFSKICNRQMHLLFPEVIILSSFLRDPAVAPGGGSHLFQGLLF